VILDPDDAALFYRAWWPLLTWVNEQRRVVPGFREPTPEHPLDMSLANKIRKVIWADDELRTGFLAAGASKLRDAERHLIASWRDRVSGKFVVFKHLQKHSIFMSESVYGVLGIYSPLAEIIPNVPMFVEAVLLPFRDRIIIDGIVESYGIQIAFGPGTRRSLNDQYARARANSQVLTSLPTGGTPKPAPRRLQPAPPPGPVPKAKAPAQSIRGEWRITATELWARDALDLVQPAFVRFGADRLGELGMIAVRAELDCRYGERDGHPLVEFTFAGDDEGDPCLGRGWAALEADGRLRGRLHIHHGDETEFVAERKPTSRRVRGGGG